MGKFCRLQFIIAVALVVFFNSEILKASFSDDPKELKSFLSVVVNTQTPLNENDIPKLQELGALNYKEIPMILLIRLDSLLQSTGEDENENKRIFDIINILLHSLKSTLGVSDVQLLERVMIRLSEESRKFTSYMNLYSEQAIEEEIPALQKQLVSKAKMFGSLIKRYQMYTKALEDIKTDALKERRTNKPEIQDKPEVLVRWIEDNLSRIQQDQNQTLTIDDRVKKIYKDDLDRIEEYMRRRVIDQPEAIDALMKLEYDLYVRGYFREKPRLLFLMGLPGVGKDTLAEAYIDAKFNQKGAEKDHLYRMPVVSSKADVWQVIGSAKGFVGSDGEVPEFIKFLVAHQGGRYRIVEEKNILGKTTQYVAENKAWRPGDILPGYYAPEDAAIFINEGHNWTKQAFDALLKQGVEKGYIRINSSNGGVEHLYSSILFLFASNHGIEELAGRDMNGKRIGKPKTYQELLEAWELLKDDKRALRDSLLSLNGTPAGGSNGETLGMSEEFANRVLDEDLILLRPLSPEGLKKIFKMKFEEYAETLRKGQSGFGYLEIDISDKLVEFAQEFKYSAEDGARPLDNKLNALINEVYGAIKDGQLTSKGVKLLYLDIEKNPDGTSNMLFRYGGNHESVLFKRLLTITERDRRLAKPTFDDFDKVANIPLELKKRIFGNDSAIEQMGKSLALTEYARRVYMANREKHRKATSFLLDGYAGLGKTQTVKELARQLTGAEEFVVFDFNFITTVDKFEEEFIGKVVNGKKIKSRFAQEYDKRKGSTMIVLLEEIGHVHPELLKRLYPFLDEDVNRTFVDKERPMSNVIFVGAANLSIDIYTKIMEMELPRDVKIRALSWVYDEFVKDPEARFKVLSQKLPVPLMTRFTDIFHYRPVNHEILRNLSQMFLSNSLEALRPKDGAIGWDIGFRTEAEYRSMIELIEAEGFEVENQGRSIRNYLERNMDKELRYLLLSNRIAENSKVVLVPRENQDLETLERNDWKALVDVYVEGRRDPLVLKMEAIERHADLVESIETYKRTAVHEAGHNIATRLLFPDKMKSVFLSIVPGVTSIMNEYIYYAGLAGSVHTEKVEWTRMAIVHRIAVLQSGAGAQRLLTKGHVDDAGKSNDIDQATRLAEKAVMLFGLSPRFQKSIDPTNEKEVSLLSEADKRVISEEVDKLLSEGKLLSDYLLKENRELLIRLSNYLLERGVVKTKEIEAFYKANEGIVRPIDNTRIAAQRSLWQQTVDKVRGWTTRRHVKNHNPEFVEGIEFTQNIRNLEVIIAEEISKEFAKAQRPQIPIINFNSQAKSMDAGSATSKSVLSIGYTSPNNLCVGLFK